MVEGDPAPRRTRLRGEEDGMRISTTPRNQHVSHPRLPGHRRFIQTSRVISFSDDRTHAETVNTRYRLRHPVTDMRFELAFPVFIALADLTAKRAADEQWRIAHDGKLLADGIRGYQIAILRMLDLLDRRPS